MKGRRGRNSTFWAVWLQASSADTTDWPGRISQICSDWYELGNHVGPASLPGPDSCGANDDKEERLGIVVMQQPTSPIGPVNWRWRWVLLRVRGPFAAGGIGSF